MKGNSSKKLISKKSIEKNECTENKPKKPKQQKKKTEDKNKSEINNIKQVKINDEEDVNNKMIDPANEQDEEKIKEPEQKHEIIPNIISPNKIDFSSSKKPEALASSASKMKSKKQNVDTKNTSITSFFQNNPKIKEAYSSNDVNNNNTSNTTNNQNKQG